MCTQSTYKRSLTYSTTAMFSRSRGSRSTPSSTTHPSSSSKKRFHRLYAAGNLRKFIEHVTIADIINSKNFSYIEIKAFMPSTALEYDVISVKYSIMVCSANGPLAHIDHYLYQLYTCLRFSVIFDCVLVTY